MAHFGLAMELLSIVWKLVGNKVLNILGRICLFLYVFRRIWAWIKRIMGMFGKSRALAETHSTIDDREFCLQVLQHVNNPGRTETLLEIQIEQLRLIHAAVVSRQCYNTPTISSKRQAAHLNDDPQTFPPESLTSPPYPPPESSPTLPEKAADPPHTPARA